MCGVTEAASASKKTSPSDNDTSLPERKNTTATAVTSGPHKLIRKCCLGLIVFKGKCLNLMRGLISVNSAQHRRGSQALL